MSLTVSNAIIIALGGVAYKMAEKFQQQIENRHPGKPMPTIRIVPFLEEDARQAGQRDLPGLGIGVRPNDPDVRRFAEQLYPHRVFPDSLGDLNRIIGNFPRPRGQIALLQHIYNIQRELQEARRAIFSTHTVDTLSQHDIHVASNRRIHVFILASLADSFMTGLLPDMPYIVQHILREGAPEDTFVNTHVVLATPGFRGDVREKEDAMASRDYARMRTHAQTDIAACAAACLREIDYFLSGSRRFSRRYSRFLTIETSHNPLGEGRVYILEPTNEQEKALDDVNALTSMVADWLYHVTMTPLRDLFETPIIREPDAAYSSFGHSSLSVPISRWVERVTVRHQIDLLSSMLSAENVDDEIDINTARSQLHLSNNELRESLLAETDFTDLRLQPLSFRGIPLSWAPQFLSKVQSRYTDLIGNKLPATRGDIHYRKRQLTSKHSELENNFVEPLEEYVLRLLDDPHGGIIKAHIFLDALRKSFKNDRKKLEEVRDQKSRAGQNMANRVEKMRVGYLGRAQVAAGVGSLPFVNLAFLLVLGLIPLALIVAQFVSSGVSIGTWAVLGVLAVLTVVIFGRTVNTLRTSRYRVLKTYDDRLQAFREVDLFNAEIQLYDELIQWTGNFRQGVNAIWEYLIDVRTDLNAKWDRVSDPTLLCGLSPDRISEYLLTLDSIQYFERRIPSDNLYEVTEALRQEIGTPSHWIQQGENRETLAEKFADFCRRRVSRELERYDLKEAIKNMPERELVGKFNRVHQLSYPYWRHDPTKVALRESPWQVVAVADTDLDVERLFGDEFQVFDIQNPYELVVTSVRHGFALSEMNYFTQILAVSYAASITREQEMLHTTADRLALPNPEDPLPFDLVIRTLPLRQLYPIARALDVIHLGEVVSANGAHGDTGLECSWTNERGHEMPLGDSPIDTIFRLERDHDLQDRIRLAVEQAWDLDTSLDMVEAWIASVDQRQPEYWARLAAEDFLNAIDNESLLV